MMNIIGLILNILGTGLIFWFGIPADVRRKGESCLLLESTDYTEIKKAKFYDMMSSLGFLCLIVGFIFQFFDALT